MINEKTDRNNTYCPEVDVRNFLERIESLPTAWWLTNLTCLIQEREILNPTERIEERPDFTSNSSWKFDN